MLKKREFLGASIYYKEAMQMAQKLGESKKLKVLKEKLNHVSKKIDFNHLGVKQRIPEKVLIELIDSIVKEEESLSLILKKIGHHPYLYPTKSVVLERSKETMPVTYNIVNLTTYDTDGHVIEGGSDPVRAWYANTYEREQLFITNLYLKRIFDSLKTRKQMDAQELYEYIEQQKTFDPRSLPIIKIGVERYFSSDYVSAIHILVPQFESTFLRLSKRLGIDVIAMKTGSGTDISTATRTLSEKHLDSVEFTKVWGEDFCEQIKQALFEPLGGKLRHKVAHGEINPNECIQENVELILYFFLVLSGRIERKQEMPPSVPA